MPTENLLRTQRTLVIGLGSTGCDVCDGLIERIEDIYDDGLSAVPWIKFLGIETEHEDSSKATARTKNFYNIDVSQERIDQAKSQPQDFDSHSDFMTWSDRATIAKWRKGAGSGNCRMIGRACLLHMDVLPEIVAEISKRLAELQSLPDEFKDSSGKKRVLSSQVRVLVCGTLVGGTGSGGLVDLGYILGKLGQTQFASRIETYGILAVPGSNIDNNHWKANAFQAVTELAHYYSPGTRYSQKVPLPQFAGGQIAPPQGKHPFDNIFLVQPRAGFQERQLDQLVASIIEFLAATGLSEATGEVDAKLINPGTIYNGRLDKRGRPQPFTSFGVSVIEYPIERIARGCAARLVAAALDRWLHRQDFDVQVAHNQFVNRLALTPTRITDDLTKVDGSEVTFEQRLGSLLKSALDSGRRNGATELSTLEVNLEVGFNPSAQGTGLVKAGEFRDQIKKRGVEVVRDRLQRVRSLLSEIVTDANRGANWTAETITVFRKRLVTESQSLANLVDPEMVEGYRAEMDEQRIRVDQAYRSFGLGILGWKGYAVHRILKQYADAAELYWQSRVQQLAAGYVREVYSKLEDMLERAESRLTDQDHGLRQWVGQLNQFASAQYAKDRDQVPVVNGFSDFRAGEDGTVDEEFSLILKSSAKPTREGVPPNVSDEEYHVLSLLLDWEVSRQGEPDETLLSNALFADTVNRYDKTAVGGHDGGTAVTVDDLATVMRLAKSSFIGALRTRNICERVVRTNSLERVTNAVNAGLPFIGIDDGDTSNGSPQGADVRVPNFAFIHGGGSIEKTPESVVREKFGVVGWHYVDSKSPHRVTIIRCRAVFSAHAIMAVRELEPFWNETKREGWDSRSRTNVDWRNMDGREPIAQFGYRMSAALTGIGLDVIKFAGGFFLDIPQITPGQPPARLLLDDSVEEMAIKIERNNASEYLVSEVKRRIAEDGNFGTVSRLDTFAKQFTRPNHLPINWFGKALSENSELPGYITLLRMRRFLESVPGLWDELQKLVTEPQTIGYRLLSNPEAYVCNYCDAFLGSRDQDDAVKQMVRCPNRACDALLQGTTGVDLHRY